MDFGKPLFQTTGAPTSLRARGCGPVAREPGNGERPVRSEHWAIQADARAAAVKYEMFLAKATQQLDAQQEAAACAIEAFLTSVHETTRRRRWWRRFAPVDRWRGTSVERAYRSLHAADVFLVQLLPREQLEARMPSVVAHAHAILEPTDPRRQEIDRLMASGSSDAHRGASSECFHRRPSGPPTRAALQEAMRIAYAASDQLQVRVRNFRNLLLVSAAIITVLMGVLVTIVAHNPNAMPFCFHPQIPGESFPKIVCPSSEIKGSSASDVLIVAGLGLVGGALSAALSILKIRGTSTPYQVPIATALLKVPSGALTAVVGIVLLGGHFVPGLSELDTQGQILAYSLVFGYAQQLATRFVDDRAQSLHASVPSETRG